MCTAADQYIDVGVVVSAIYKTVLKSTCLPVCCIDAAGLHQRRAWGGGLFRVRQCGSASLRDIQRAGSAPTRVRVYSQVLQ